MLADKIKLLEESLVNSLREMLPHGSGIDSDWVLDMQWAKSRIVATNSYHCMDENGYYCGWADFTIYIALPSCDFRLFFNGDISQMLNQKYALGDYLGDTISQALRNKSC